MAPKPSESVKSGIVKVALVVAQILGTYLMLVAIVCPPILAAELWDPLDNSLYWAGFGVGCAACALTFGVPIRGRRDQTWRLLGCLAPPWTIFFAAGANAWFDRSPAVPHASRYLGRAPSSKRAGAYRVAWLR
jgi:hypothetical protein